MLPQEFTNRMQNMLGDAYEAFIACYDQEPCHALRLNRMKIGQMPVGSLPFALSAVPWSSDGYYYSGQDAPGRHPYHDAGVYYIQEPSAMAPAEFLEVQPGDTVLDLCAAPGGKSVQIASKMSGSGVLICNEIHPARAKALSENVERMGVRNAIVTNETPQKLADRFIEYFDKILVDAPCSGEGMFRKKEAACQEWSMEQVQLCAKRQDEILSCAARMLRPGGRLVYSTCTFAPEENEGSVSRFLKHFPEFAIVPVTKCPQMSPGNPAWVAEAADQIEETIRLFPHQLRGEGHYLAVFEKQDSIGYGANKIHMEHGISRKDCREWLDFQKENLLWQSEGIYLAFGGQLYLAPQGTPSLKGLKVLRPGLHLGSNKKNRLEPSHALALCLKKEEVRHVIDFASDGPDIRAYLNGQAIAAQGERGWNLVLTDGYSIGWGKYSGGILKNHYPKGLRRSIQS